MVKIADLIPSSPAFSLSPDTTLDQAAKEMLALRVSAFLVVEQDEAVGIVTEGDLLHAVREQQPRDLPVARIMTSPVFSVSADTEHIEAYRIAAKQGLRHLVVVDDHNMPLGVVSESDFRRYLGLDFYRRLNNVGALMEHHFPRLPPDATLEEAVAAMETVRVSCVFVVEEGRPLGIVTEHDGVRMFLQRAGNPALSEIMTFPVRTVTPETPIAEAVAMMLESSIRHMAVVDGDGRIVGLLAEHTLMRPLEMDLVDKALDERLQFAKALAEEGNRLQLNDRYQRALLDNFPFMVWLKDTESRFLAVNKPFAIAAGLTSIESVPGKKDIDIWPEDLATRYLSDDQEVMRQGNKKFSLEPLQRSGKRYWYETYRAPVVGDDGILLGTVGFSRDVTEYRQAEEAVLIRNAALAGVLRGERLEGILELLAVALQTECPDCLCAIYTKDPHADILHIAAAPGVSDKFFETIEHLKIEEGNGLSATTAFRRQRVVISDVEIDAVPLPYRPLLLEEKIISGWAEPIFHVSGTLLGVCTVFRRVRGEPDREQTSRLVQTSQLASLLLSQYHHQQQVQDNIETFTGIFEGIHSGILVLDAAGNILNSNHSAQRLLALSAEQLLGKTFYSFSAEGFNDLSEIQAQLNIALSGHSRTFLFWGQQQGQQVFPMQMSFSPSRYFGQMVVLASFEDISERHAAELRQRAGYSLTKALAGGASRTALLETLFRVALGLPEFDSGGAYWVNERELNLACSNGFSTELVSLVRQIPADSPLVNKIVGGELDICQFETPWLGDQYGLQTGLLEAGVRLLLILPLSIDGKVCAALCLASKACRAVSSATLTVLESFAEYFAQALARIDAKEENHRLQDNLVGLFNTLKDFVFIATHEGTIIHCNESAKTSLGFEPALLVGKNVKFIHPLEDGAVVDETLVKIVAGEKSQCVVPLKAKDEKIIPVETEFTHGYWNGAPVLIGVCRDISERLAAEARQRLAASVFDNAHEGIMITNPKGIIVDVNPAFTELTGYSRVEAIGQNAGMLRSGHHDADFYQAMWASIGTQGFWQREVWNRKKNGQLFAEMLNISSVKADSGEISHYVAVFSDITVIKEHQERLEQMAHFDPLTQLPNRVLLGDRLQLAMAQTERSNKLLAVCYLDLDGFKPVNDNYGHAAGDHLLIEVSRRLRQCVRAGDTVARLGGDEFVLLFSALEDTLEADRAISRVLSTLSQPFLLKQEEVHISASIGVALYPLDHADADALLRHADQAMYVAKQNGRNCYRLFDPETDRVAQQRRSAWNRIYEGLRRCEFSLYYQPKVNMREGRVIGAEALIRWHHPEDGLLLPARFLNVVEGTELDAALGDWVLNEALRQLDEWRRQGLDLSVSVNISAMHVQSENFVERLRDLLSLWPEVPAENLELEILETAALEDVKRVSAVFNACRGLGVRLALDDFGTGYSSLTYFRRLPADTLKIDQSFVRDMLEDPDDLAIVEGVIGMTKAFGREVIAEGVETAEHGMVLLQLGCDLAQGYGIARPMPAVDLPAWVKSFRPHELWNSIASFAWSREDLSMLVADVDHERWVRTLYAVLNDPERKLLPRELDASRCRFGLWYAGEGARRYSHLEGFRNIGKIHERLHYVGHQLLWLVQNSAAKSDSQQEIANLKDELAEMVLAMSEAIQVLQVEVLMERQLGHRL